MQGASLSPVATRHNMQYIQLWPAHEHPVVDPIALLKGPDSSRSLFPPPSIPVVSFLSSTRLPNYDGIKR